MRSAEQRKYTALLDGVGDGVTYAKRVAVVDFETKGIQRRPQYPPEPVGVSIEEPGKPVKYMAWAHASGNNCKKRDAVRELKRIYKKYDVCFHNGKFDLDVGETHLGLKWPKHYHDTMFLAFLSDPHSNDLGLKGLAEKILDLPPDEQTELKTWVMENVPEAKGKPKTWKEWGAYIWKAPGDLAGKYANGDTLRTGLLFRHLLPEIISRGMAAPYVRELVLMPILLGSERRGVHIDRARLANDLAGWEADEETLINWLRRKLKTPELDIDKGDELADALERSGFVDPADWVRTKTGKRSTSKDNILACIKDRGIREVLLYRSKMINSVRMFARPWLAQAAESGGVIFTTWHQVRGDKNGARTGRLSSTPNFQNMPKNPEDMPLPAVLARKMHGMPNMRDYIIPRHGCVFIGRDYSQQELRILGHFEDGVLLAEYQANPEMDIHDLALLLLTKMLGVKLLRKTVKTLGFGLIYGMGLGALAKAMGVDVVTAKRIKAAYLRIFPGLAALIKALKEMAQANRPLRTWGGREYHVEAPRVIGGRIRTFEYKLINILIQGSAADCTKQAIINYDATGIGEILINVHDELLCQTTVADAAREMGLLEECMADVAFDVAMLSDGKVSDVSWARMKEVNFLKLKPTNQTEKRSEKMDTKTKIKELRAEIKELRAEIKDANATAKSYKADIKPLAAGLKATEKTIVRKKAGVAKLQEKIAKLQAKT